jgi:hypothetical protein
MRVSLTNKLCTLFYIFSLIVWGISIGNYSEQKVQSVACRVVLCSVLFFDGPSYDMQCHSSAESTPKWGQHFFPSALLPQSVMS